MFMDFWKLAETKINSRKFSLTKNSIEVAFRVWAVEKF